jgi:hypothetical protein
MYYAWLWILRVLFWLLVPEELSGTFESDAGNDITDYNQRWSWITDQMYDIWVNNMDYETRYDAMNNGQDFWQVASP